MISKSRPGHILRKAVGIVGVRGFATVASFGLSVLLARRFGSIGAGEYYSVMGTASIVAAVLLRGADLLLVREVGHWVVSPGRAETLRELTGQVVQAMLSNSRTPIAVLSVIALIGLYSLTGSPNGSMALLAGSSVLLVTQMASSLAQGLGRPGSALILQSAALPIVTMPLAFLFLAPSTSGLLISSALLTICISACFGYYLIRREDSKHEQSCTGNPDRLESSTFMDHAAMNPFFWMTLGNQIIAWCPVLVLYFLKDASSAGVFSAATKLANTLPLGVMVSNAIITKPLAASIARRDVSAINQIILEATLAGALIGVFPLAALLLFSNDIMALFGPAFVAAAPVMKILLLGQAVLSGVGPSTFVLIMCRKESWIARTTLIIAGGLMVMLPVGLLLGTERTLAWIYSAVVALNGLTLFYLSRLIVRSIGDPEPGLSI